MLCCCCFRVRSASGNGQLCFGLNRYSLHFSSFVVKSLNKNEQTGQYVQLCKYIYHYFFPGKEIMVSKCTFSAVWGFHTFVNVLKIGKVNKWKYFNPTALCSCSPSFSAFAFCLIPPYFFCSVILICFFSSFPSLSSIVSKHSLLIKKLFQRFLWLWPLDDLCSEKSDNQWETDLICLLLRHQDRMSFVSRAQPQAPRIFLAKQHKETMGASSPTRPILRKTPGLGTKQSREDDFERPQKCVIALTFLSNFVLSDQTSRGCFFRKLRKMFLILRHSAFLEFNS